MKLYQAHFTPPAAAPYDREDWFWQIYGHVLLPIVEQQQPNRFWFTYYVENGVRHVEFRYEAPDKFDDATWALNPTLHAEFDIIHDLSGGRFLGTNQRNTSAPDRGNLMFDFLHQAARLTLSQLSHIDQGYWQLETNADFGNNHYGFTLESPHHLLCNMSNMPLGVVIIKFEMPPFEGVTALSPLYAKLRGLYNNTLPVIKVKF